MNKTVKVGIPFTPSKLISRTLENVTRIRYKSGQCSVAVYTKDKNLNLNNKFITILDLEAGNNVTINTNDIVDIRNYQHYEVVVLNLGNNSVGIVNKKFTQHYIFDESDNVIQTTSFVYLDDNQYVHKWNQCEQ